MTTPFHENRLSDADLMDALAGYQRAIKILQECDLCSDEPITAMRERLSEIRGEALRRGLIQE